MIKFQFLLFWLLNLLNLLNELQCVICNYIINLDHLDMKMSTVNGGNESMSGNKGPLKRVHPF